MNLVWKILAAIVVIVLIAKLVAPLLSPLYPPLGIIALIAIYLVVIAWVLGYMNLPLP